jgi:hypothetical protein
LKFNAKATAATPDTNPFLRTHKWVPDRRGSLKAIKDGAMNEIALEYDNRPLAYRVGVLKDDGTEGSIPTIRRAFQYLNSELGEWKATPEWQSALDMLAVAHSEYTPVNIKMATDLLKATCRRAGKLDPHSP